ncbi:hypothetical protein GFS31_17070 [Leptolyngbya sp. BL0902]|nr:hypothetical protein GFS31_17070 [Leptolyngbya sp. BL0902]
MEIQRTAATPKVGFPEFESFHLADFSAKAQFSKSVASTIPPRPHDATLGLARGNVVYYSTTNWPQLQPPPQTLGARSGQ